MGWAAEDPQLSVDVEELLPLIDEGAEELLAWRLNSNEDAERRARVMATRLAVP
jgi:hypothetical protein